MDENDALTGGEELSIDQAAAAYAKVSTSNAADTGQAEEEEQDGSEQAEDELQASEEDAGEEVEGDPDPEGDPDESDEDAEPESDQGRFVSANGKHRFPDGTVLTVAEMAAGYMKEKDYRQKTMETAEGRKANEAQSTALKQREQQLTQQAELVSTLIQSIVGEEPDPSMLQTDPMGYIAQKENRERWIAHLNTLHQQRQQAEQATTAESQKTRKERADTEWTALLDKAPEFKDQKKTEAFVNDVHKFGTETYGFTKDEIREAVGLDHRQALVLKDAIAWRKLQASKANLPKKIEGRPPVQKAGKRLNSSEQRARGANDALSRLKQTGSEADAVAAYLASQKG